jgi:hypothetical protein
MRDVCLCSCVLVPLHRNQRLGLRLRFSLAAQLMSYGSSSGEVYLSDATLAFLEDTGATSQRELCCRSFWFEEPSFVFPFYIGLIP